MELLHWLVVSLISGFSEFMMVSGEAHQILYITTAGIDQPDRVILLAIHLGWLGALWLSCRKRLRELRYERRIAVSTRRRRTRYPDPSALMDMRIINSAAVPVLIGLLLVGFLPSWTTKTGWIVLFLFVNSIVLVMPRLFSSGNKDSLSYTMLDGLLMGLAAILGLFPGISRLACLFSVGLLRGAQKRYSLELSLLISIPVSLGLICTDVFMILRAGLGLDGIGFLSCVLACLASFTGAYLAIRLLRYFCDRINTTCFAYYSCGLAVFQFLLYLIIP